MSGFCTLQAIVLFGSLYPIHGGQGFREEMWLDKGSLLQVFAFLHFDLRQLFYQLTPWIKIYRINPENISWLEIRCVLFFLFFWPHKPDSGFICMQTSGTVTWLIKVGQCNLSCQVGKKVIRRGTGVSDMCAEDPEKLAFHLIWCQQRNRKSRY